MGLIQGIITDNFILVGADKDIFRLNKQMIVGYSGDISDNYELLKDYCQREDDALVADSIFPEISYTTLLPLLEERFLSMKQTHEDLQTDKTYKISTILCGHNGSRFEITIFTLGMEDKAPNGIIKASRTSKLPYQAVTLGDPFYSQKLHTMVHAFYHTYPELNLLRYKQILEQVFIEAAKKDASIAGTLHFEKIKKRDVL